MGKGAAVTLAVIAAIVGFGVGRSSNNPPPSSAAATVTVTAPPEITTKVESQIPNYCGPAIMFAKFAWNDMVDPSFLLNYRQFSNLPVDSDAWHKAAVNLAYWASGVYSSDYGEAFGAKAAIPKCWARWVKQDTGD